MAGPTPGEATVPAGRSPEPGARWEGAGGRPAAQQPRWPDQRALRAAVAELADSPPLASAAECELLRRRLANVARGRAFLLQGGDCAETFARVGAEHVGSTLRTLLAMSLVVSRAGGLPVVKTARIAGQYAKPRSRPTEARRGEALPAYRGDAVNGVEFTAASRRPDPRRLVRAYHASAATLHLMRMLGADLLPEDSHAPDGPAVAGEAAEYAAEFFTCHEALLIAYEDALVRADRRTGQPYGSSGHMLWIGERTRQLDGAHVEFAARVRNPVGVKLGPTATPDEALALVDRLDPKREPGRLVFLTRMGSDTIRDRLGNLVEKVAASGAEVIWVCDPMHGNTFVAPSGHKTRDFEHVVDEITGFFEVHRSLGTHPGGVHVELTGDPVTECVGGPERLGLEDLPRRYETACDPRLNGRQARDVAQVIAGLLAEDR